MTAHQPAREGDGGSANIDKECPVLHVQRLLFGSLFLFLITIKNIEIEVNNYG